MSHVINTEYGEFNLVSYEDILSNTMHVALVKGDLKNGKSLLLFAYIFKILLRDILAFIASFRLAFKNAMQRINNEGNGVILILRWNESVNAIIKDIENIKDYK